jgi:hypothetical protein
MRKSMLFSPTCWSASNGQHRYIIECIKGRYGVSVVDRSTDIWQCLGERRSLDDAIGLCHDHARELQQ